MSDLSIHVGIMVGVLVVCFAGPLLAIFFLVQRKRRARSTRRSPIGIALLRGPGHSLREQIDTTHVDLIFDVMLLIVVPLSALTLLLALGHVRGLAIIAGIAPVFMIGALGFVAYVTLKLVKAGSHLDHLKAGYDAEVAVGQELDLLMRQGAATYHDLPADNFNIDHVVISCSGVFAVETKGFTKPKKGGGRANAQVVFDGQTLKFPTWTTKEPLEQAEKQAAWLSKWLTSAVGFTVHARPVVALPGWFVERAGAGKVLVFSGKALSGLLKFRGQQTLSEQDVQRIAHQIEQRCRTVTPLFAEDKKAF
jgi:Nuclease-related domain